MKITLIVGLVLCVAQGIFACPPGWTHYRANCYKLFTTSLSKAEAELSCLANGATLAEPLGAHDNRAIKSVAGGRHIWIGLNDIKTENRFVLTHGGNNVGYTNWASQEPNNSHNEDCVEMYKNGLWNDLPCSHKRGYVCQQH